MCTVFLCLPGHNSAVWVRLHSHTLIITLLLFTQNNVNCTISNTILHNIWFHEGISCIHNVCWLFIWLQTTSSAQWEWIFLTGHGATPNSLSFSKALMFGNKCGMCECETVSWSQVFSVFLPLLLFQQQSKVICIQHGCILFGELSTDQSSTEWVPCNLTNVCNLYTKHILKYKIALSALQLSQ